MPSSLQQMPVKNWSELFLLSPSVSSSWALSPLRRMLPHVDATSVPNLTLALLFHNTINFRLPGLRTFRLHTVTKAHTGQITLEKVKQVDCVQQESERTRKSDRATAWERYASSWTGTDIPRTWTNRQLLTLWCRGHGPLGVTTCEEKSAQHAGGYAILRWLRGYLKCHLQKIRETLWIIRRQAWEIMARNEFTWWRQR